MLAQTLTSLLALSLPSGAAEDWSQFRGPDHSGRSSETGVPLQWSATENIAWKTPISGESWSSPIVWGDRVFVTTATDGGRSCRILSLDRKSGRVLWDKEVFTQKTLRKEQRNTYATPTPTTDGERIYACFGDGSFAAVNLAGEIVWTNRDYPFYSQHGLGSSPILHNGLLVMARDGSSEGPDKALGWQKPWDQSYLVALDAKTGKERWKAKRGLSRISHGTPTDWTAPGGKRQIVSEAGDVVQGFDLETGERLWSSKVIGEGKAPSTIVGDGLVFTAGGWGGNESIKAFRLGERGDLGELNRAWEVRQAMPKVPSMIYVAPHLYAITDQGVVSCLDAGSGKKVWRERLTGGFSASPVSAERRLYFTADDGTTHVLAAGPQFKVLAKNTLGETVQASPAISNGCIFIRTEHNVFCIGPQR